ncbi:hypothetical protein COLO4_26395 [Corchorus olitorius]|uniref:Uncharacterized protein n=1 Tax=Corchorus olitorius TaxID=93759 RepID=A0A1R3HX85_9ROSI|nr:hypothetical protein COLO4_26395 [Corchorus olitorius]
MPKGKRLHEDYTLRSLNKGKIVCASGSDSNSSLKLGGKEKSGVAISRFGGVEPFRGKSGSVSFHGLTHQLMEESKLMSAPFQEEKGSLLWVLAPVALICSFILPQFFFNNAIEALFREETLVEIVSTLCFEVMFYIGVGVFLLVTDRVQRPYLEFSAKRWGLITGLRGYLTSSFFTMGFKVVAPLLAVFATWPVLGIPALVAVAPFLLGCAAQFAFETILEKRVQIVPVDQSYSFYSELNDLDERRSENTRGDEES